MPNWRKWSSFRLSVTLGFISWIALGLLSANSTPNGAVDKAIGTLFVPVTRATYRLAALVFPGSDIPHSTGWYLLPLIALLGNLVVLTVLWYLCVRAVRALRPEWAPVPSDPVIPQDGENDWGESESEEEPVYIPPDKTYATRFGSTIDYEKFKLRNWKQFRKHRGHWPLFSILFHYLSLVGMLVNVIAFFKMRDQNDWSTSKSWLIGGVLAIAWCGFFVCGQKLMWKLDWRLSGRNEIGFEPKARNLF